MLSLKIFVFVEDFFTPWTIYSNINGMDKKRGQFGAPKVRSCVCDDWNGVMGNFTKNECSRNFKIMLPNIYENFWKKLGNIHEFFWAFFLLDEWVQKRKA